MDERRIAKADVASAHKPRRRESIRSLPHRGAHAAETATTSASAEYLLVVILVLLRSVAILQSIPRLVLRWDDGYGASTSVLIGALVGFAAWSVAYLWIVVARRTVRVHTATRVDVLASSVVLLAVGFAHESSALSASTWSQWAFGLVAPVAVYAGILPRLRERIAGAGLLFGCFLLPLLATQVPSAVLEVSSVAIAMPAQTAIGFYVAKYLTALADEAETAREVAAREAAVEEAARHRALLHDQASILTFIARGADDDPRLAQALRRQAAEEARRVSAFINRRAAPLRGTSANATSLAGIAAEVADAFPDLDPVVTTDLAHGVRLNPAASRAVRDSLTTLLHNVRLHAAAGETVVHAAADETGWEASVADNGRGFDSGAVTWGYGLAEIVVGGCAKAGVQVRIDSHPGVGTLVVLRGGHDTLA